MPESGWKRQKVTIEDQYLAVLVFAMFFALGVTVGYMVWG